MQSLPATASALHRLPARVLNEPLCADRAEGWPTDHQHREGGSRLQTRGKVQYGDAVVLLADMRGVALRAAGDMPVQRLYDAAYDAMSLFGARHLLTFGTEFLAVFVDVALPAAVPARTRAARAASALLDVAKRLACCDMVPEQAPAGLAVALHTGPTALLRVRDPLQRFDDAWLATGETVEATRALCDHALRARWALASSARTLACMDKPARTGRRGAVPLPSRGTTLDALEVLGVD